MAVLARRQSDLPPTRGPAREEMGRGFKLSLILHLAIATFILAKSLIYPGDPLMVAPALRVDVVGLPDILKKDLKSLPKLPSADEMADKLKQAETEAAKIKPVAPPPKEAEEEASPDDMVLKPKVVNKAKPTQKTEKPEDRSKRLKSALERIKALDKINAAPEASESKKAGVLIKGNRVSKGTSLSGDARESMKAGYLDELRDRLQEHWALPVWLERQKLSAQVLIYIDGYGRVRGVQFLKPSNNAQFDDQVRRTIQQSQPFPTPPEDLATALMGQGIVVGFPL